MLEERVAETITRYSMFAPGQRVGVAVSGGADSVALLYLLVALAPRWCLQLTVLHLDHGLRGAESDEDAQFVASLAAGFGLPLEAERIDVAGLARARAANLEQVGRDGRREFFSRYLTDGVLERVAQGHTRSDQAETVLFRLLRGTGITGLAGILPVTREGLVRPLIEVDRGEIRSYLGGLGATWREDSSNHDLRFARNRIRHQLLPELERQWNPAISDALARLAVLARDEEQVWDREVARLAADHLTWRPPCALIRPGDLKRLPRALARRLIRHAIGLVRGDLTGIDFDDIEQVLSLAAVGGRGERHLAGLVVTRSFDWIRLAPPAEAGSKKGYEIPLPVPGVVSVPGAPGGLSLELAPWPDPWPDQSPTAGNPGYNNDRGVDLDWGLISGPLRLRGWREGDRYRPSGRSAAEKLKVMFQKARIPSWDRQSWPIITSEGKILWTRRFGASEEYAVQPHTRPERPGTRWVLRVREVDIPRVG